MLKRKKKRRKSIPSSSPVPPASGMSAATAALDTTNNTTLAETVVGGDDDDDVFREAAPAVPAADDEEEEERMDPSDRRSVAMVENGGNLYAANEAAADVTAAEATWRAQVSGCGRGWGRRWSRRRRGLQMHIIYFIHPCFEGGGTTRWMQRWRQRGEDGNRRGGA